MAGQQKKQSGGGLVTFLGVAMVIAITAVPDLGIMPVVIVVLLLAIVGFARAAVGGKKRQNARQVPGQAQTGSSSGQTPSHRIGEAVGFGQYRSSEGSPSSNQTGSSNPIEPFNPIQPSDPRQQSHQGRSSSSTAMSQADQQRLKSDIRKRLASTQDGRQALKEHDRAGNAGQQVITRRQNSQSESLPSTRPGSQAGPRTSRPTSAPQPSAPRRPSGQGSGSARRRPGSEIDFEDVDLSDAESQLRPGADVNLRDVTAGPVGDDLNLPARSRAHRPEEPSTTGPVAGSSAISDAEVTSSLLGSALASSSLFSSGRGSSLTLTSLSRSQD